MKSIKHSSKRHLQPESEEPNKVQSRRQKSDASLPGLECTNDHNMENVSVEKIEAEAGVSSIEAISTVWGKRGKWLVIAG